MAGHSGSIFGRPECRLVPAIHVHKSQAPVLQPEVVDARDKRGHDGSGAGDL
jgi:hypothetical protein